MCWYGSVLWDLFSKNAIKVENIYNRSVKIMLDLPVETHRGLIVPVSGKKHVKFILLKRFFKFIQSINISNKPLLRRLMLSIRDDARSTTGRNLKSLMLLTRKTSVVDIEMGDLETLRYHPMGENEELRLEMIELVMEKRKSHELDTEEEELRTLLCIS
jgi:hypothetical protein